MSVLLGENKKAFERFHLNTYCIYFLTMLQEALFPIEELQ